MLEQFFAKFGDMWVLLGLLGQSFFFIRFLVQWVWSEKKGESVIPLSFWYFSIAGATIVLAYGLRQLDPVLILGQTAGLAVYCRNLYLIRKKRRNTSVEPAE